MWPERDAADRHAGRVVGDEDFSVRGRVEAWEGGELGGEGLKGEGDFLGEGDERGSGDGEG